MRNIEINDWESYLSAYDVLRALENIYTDYRDDYYEYRKSLNAILGLEYSAEKNEQLFRNTEQNLEEIAMYLFRLEMAMDEYLDKRKEEDYEEDNWHDIDIESLDIPEELLDILLSTDNCVCKDCEHDRECCDCIFYYSHGCDYAPGCPCEFCCEEENENKASYQELEKDFGKYSRLQEFPAIEKVLYNNPATIVFWTDHTKTIVRCLAGDTYSKEAGLALCYAKKMLGNKEFRRIFDEYVPEEKKSKKKTTKKKD